ncbi:MAG: hypothetical protein JWO35_135 [Candidatus Saccharibacteria bacterium]|nr:hypothetical protein [Candidatus Saccharibacteria bacterium]
MAETTNQPVTPGAGASPKPGDTIVPAGAPRPADQRVSALDAPQPQPVAQPAAAPTPPPQPIAPPAPIPTPTPAPQPEPTLDTHPAAEDDGSISWTASEFVAHEKSASWYGSLAVVAVFGAGLVYLLTKDVVSSAVILFSALILGFYGARQPRQLQYRISEHGISVGQKNFAYEEFRSFTVAPDGAFSSIIFKPLKRFATLTTIYYAPEDEEQIVDVLADRLPFEEHAPDAVDRLMRRIRF